MSYLFLYVNLFKHASVLADQKMCVFCSSLGLETTTKDFKPQV